MMMQKGFFLIQNFLIMFKNAFLFEGMVLKSIKEDFIISI